jgi:hypothetical protein
MPISQYLQHCEKISAVEHIPLNKFLLGIIHSLAHFHGALELNNTIIKSFHELETIFENILMFESVIHMGLIHEKF